MSHPSPPPSQSPSATTETPALDSTDRRAASQVLPEYSGHWRDALLSPRQKDVFQALQGVCASKSTNPQALEMFLRLMGEQFHLLGHRQNWPTGLQKAFDQFFMTAGPLIEAAQGPTDERTIEDVTSVSQASPVVHPAATTQHLAASEGYSEGLARVIAFLVAQGQRSPAKAFCAELRVRLKHAAPIGLLTSEQLDHLFDLANDWVQGRVFTPFHPTTTQHLVAMQGYYKGLSRAIAFLVDNHLGTEAREFVESLQDASPKEIQSCELLGEHDLAIIAEFFDAPWAQDLDAEHAARAAKLAEEQTGHTLGGCPS